MNISKNAIRHVPGFNVLTQHGLILPLCLFILIAVFIAGYFPLLTRVFFDFSFNRGEGWNAYAALRLLETGSPYPSDINGLTTYNYPPLYVLIQYFFLSLGIDPVLGGRLLSVMSQITVALVCFKYALRYSESWLFSAFIFLAFMCFTLVTEVGYVGLSDPQWLATALASLAVDRALSGTGDIKNKLLVASLILASGLVKHNGIGTPIALTVYYFSISRASGINWLYVCGILVAVAVATIVALFPTALDFILFQPRTYAAFRIAKSMTNIILPLVLIPVILSVSLLKVQRDDGNIKNEIYPFLLIFPIISFIIATFFYGGIGVSANIYFETIFATWLVMAIAGGSAFKRLSSDRKIPFGLSQTTLIVAAATVFAGFLDRGVSPLQVLSYPTLVAQQAEIIRHIREVDGPVACKDPLHCYRAGKAFVWDGFHIAQSSNNKESYRLAFEERLKSQYYAAFALQCDLWEPRQINGRATQLVRDGYESKKRIGDICILMRREAIHENQD